MLCENVGEEYKIKVYYDGDKTKQIEAKIIEKYGKNEKEWAENGYNVSEVCSCEMKCFNRRTGVEERFTKIGIGFLVFGIIAEQIITAVFPPEQCQYEENLNETIFGHMDVYEDFVYPLEGKATAKQIFKAIDLPIYWVMQIVNYITMSRGNKGWLIILNLFTRSFAAYCVELSSEDKLNQIEVVMDKKTRFDWAITHKDPSHLTIDPEEYELCHYKQTCSRRQECKQKHLALLKEKKSKS